MGVVVLSFGGGSASGGVAVTSYANFSAFPASAAIDDLAWAKSAQGVWGVNRKPTGLYSWDGSKWQRESASLSNYTRVSAVDTRVLALEGVRFYTPERQFYDGDNNVSYYVLKLSPSNYTVNKQDTTGAITRSKNNSTDITKLSQAQTLTYL